MGKYRWMSDFFDKLLFYEGFVTFLDYLLSDSFWDCFPENRGDRLPEVTRERSGSSSRKWFASSLSPPEGLHPSLSWLLMPLSSPQGVSPSWSFSTQASIHPVRSRPDRRKPPSAGLGLFPWSKKPVSLPVWVLYSHLTLFLLEMMITDHPRWVIKHLSLIEPVNIPALGL